MSERTIIDASEQNFQEEVIEESNRRPVVVDLWAPWCGPCRTLGPILERLAEEEAGAFLLAKVNVDENPAISQAFQVRGIPAVHALRDGKVVDSFTGALPEVEVRAWLRGFLPGPEAALLAQAATLLKEGKLGEAKASFQKVLEVQPRNGEAHFQLAKLLVGEGQQEAAERHLGLILPDDGSRLEKEISALRLKMSGDGLDEAERAAAASPDDLGAKLRLGRSLAASEHYERALETFFEVLKASPKVGAGEEARQAMVEVFGAIGARSELAERYRAMMAAELYK